MAERSDLPGDDDQAPAADPAPGAQLRACGRPPTCSGGGVGPGRPMGSHSGWCSMEEDRPLATVALTDWGDRWSCEALVVPNRAGSLLPRLWPSALHELDRLDADAIQTSIRDDDLLMAELATNTGFAPTPTRYAETWMEAS